MKEGYTTAYSKRKTKQNFSQFINNKVLLTPTEIRYLGLYLDRRGIPTYDIRDNSITEDNYEDTTEISYD